MGCAADRGSAFGRSERPGQHDSLGVSEAEPLLDGAAVELHHHVGDLLREALCFGAGRDLPFRSDSRHCIARCGTVLDLRRLRAMNTAPPTTASARIAGFTIEDMSA